MLNVKFEKTGCASFLSHIDMQRAINRTIKRAGFSPRYSQGYHPHILLKLSSPIPLGLESKAEYFSLDIDVADKGAFLVGCNQHAPQGLRFVKAWATEKNPNFAARLAASDYLVFTSALIARKNTLYPDVQKGLVATTKVKGVETQTDVSDKVYGIKVHEDDMLVRLASGNTVLRIDRFLDALNTRFDTNIVMRDAIKTTAYVLSDRNSFLDMDALLEQLESEFMCEPQGTGTNH